MKTTVKIKLLLLCLLLFPNLQAQVTLGIMEAPADGALLQLKDIVGAVPGSKNAEKGLLMPRVELVNSTTLYPIVANFYLAAEQEKHVGLIVYNLTENLEVGLIKGLMVWNGTQWNSIQNKKEVTEDIGTDVKKNLYTDKIPRETVIVPFHSINIKMVKAKYQQNPSYYALPQFNGTPASGTRSYEYYISQYWNSTKKGYSNDVLSQTFSMASGGYKNFVDSDMSPIERNEVWMYDNTTDKIYHIQFFIMGENTANATKIYAIMAEEF